MEKTIELTGAAAAVAAVIAGGAALKTVAALAIGVVPSVVVVDASATKSETNINSMSSAFGLF